MRDSERGVAVDRDVRAREWLFGAAEIAFIDPEGGVLEVGRDLFVRERWGRVQQPGVQRKLVFEVRRIGFVELEFSQLRAVEKPVLTGRKDVPEPAGVVCAVWLGRHRGTSGSHRQRQAGEAERGREQAQAPGPRESA